MRAVIHFAVLSLVIGTLTPAGAIKVSTANHRTRIPKSGSTVLSAGSSKSKADVTIQTVTVGGNCLSASPAVNSSKDYGAEEGIVVQRMSMSVSGKPIAVPTAAYSGLFNIMWASLTYNGDMFDLTINEGVDLYLIHIYFSARSGVTRMTVYDYLARERVEDAHFYPTVIE